MLVPNEDVLGPAGRRRRRRLRGGQPVSLPPCKLPLLYLMLQGTLKEGCA